MRPFHGISGIPDAVSCRGVFTRDGRGRQLRLPEHVTSQHPHRDSPTNLLVAGRRVNSVGHHIQGLVEQDAIDRIEAAPHAAMPITDSFNGHMPVGSQPLGPLTSQLRVSLDDPFDGHVPHPRPRQEPQRGGHPIVHPQGRLQAETGLGAGLGDLGGLPEPNLTLTTRSHNLGCRCRRFNTSAIRKPAAPTEIPNRAATSPARNSPILGVPDAPPVIHSSAPSNNTVSSTRCRSHIAAIANT